MLNKIESQDDFNKIQDFFEHNVPYSDYSAISLLSWSHGKSVWYLLAEEGLVIKIPTYLGIGYTYSAYLLKRSESFLNELCLLSNKFHNVPECSLEFFPGNVAVAEDRDAFDYVYSIENLATIGRGDTRLARNINKFETDFKNITYKRVDLLDKQIGKSLIELCTEWCLAKDFSPEDTQAELYAIKTYINYSTSIHDFSIGIFDENKLIAFTLNEIHSEKWGIGHFGKSSYKYKNSSLISEIYSARLLSEEGVKYLNHQQDTGILSLRDFKESLQPSKFLKKYTVEF